MREILFRGKPKQETVYYFFSQIWKDNCKDGFVYGSLIVSNGRYYICVSALCSINCCVNNGTISMIEVIPETVGQCTGLTDKNDKKIFENDIVKIPVYFDCGCYPHTEIRTKVVKIPTFYTITFDGDIEIIGNITDNPELIESRDNK